MKDFITLVFFYALTGLVLLTFYRLNFFVTLLADSGFLTCLSNYFFECTIQQFEFVGIHEKSFYCSAFIVVIIWLYTVWVSASRLTLSRK